MTKLILYTKPRCHLCDEMKNELASLGKDFEYDLVEVNIETDKDLFERYKEKIPALMINGIIFAKFRLDLSKLKTKLSVNNI
jgi:glutaredoxin